MYIESFTASQANHSWPCISFQQCLTFGLFEATPEAYRNLKFTTSQFLRITSAANNKLSMRMRFLNKLFQLASSYTASFSQCIHIAMDASDVQFKRTDLTLNQTICCIDLHGSVDTKDINKYDDATNDGDDDDDDDDDDGA
ncbi:hypothetical protein GQX74_006585 [Glossina fuscipes]|nr:hypothetical protein GQX74_006585 [Glossina fuscipes]